MIAEGKENSLASISGFCVKSFHEETSPSSPCPAAKSRMSRGVGAPRRGRKNRALPFEILGKADPRLAAYFLARNFSQLFAPFSAGASVSVVTGSRPHNLSESSLIDRVMAALGA